MDQAEKIPMPRYAAASVSDKAPTISSSCTKNSVSAITGSIDVVVKPLNLGFWLPVEQKYRTLHLIGRETIFDGSYSIKWDGSPSYGDPWQSGLGPSSGIFRE